jgi:hypothetical protein
MSNTVVLREPGKRKFDLVLLYVKSGFYNRHTYRMVPVSGSCVTNLPEIQALCRNIFTSFLSRHPDGQFSVSGPTSILEHTLTISIDSTRLNYE